MSGSDDYYAWLGVAANVNAMELRRVWRQLARRWHPDHAGPGATAAFQKLSAAYAVLSDPIARAAYDRRRHLAAPAAAAAGPRPAAPATRRRAPSVMLRRLCGPLASLLACGAARRVDATLLELILSAEEAAQGGMISIAMRVPVHRDGRVSEELFSAWLAVPPEIADGAMLTPSELLPGMEPVSFRMRVLAARK